MSLSPEWYLFSDGDSDTEFGEEEDFSQAYVKGPPANPASLPYINLTDTSFSLDFSPPSSPEKDPGGEWSWVWHCALCDFVYCLTFLQTDSNDYAEGLPILPASACLGGKSCLATENWV